MTEFGLDARNRSHIELLESLNRFLLDQILLEREAVLIIDEAQDLTFDLLEQVRLLSNLETDQRKLLQIILIGQPELRTKLNDPRLRQLRQRITVRYHLRSLTRTEMVRHIHQRLRVAAVSRERTPSFKPMALRTIYRYSKGIPRLVNAACDMALLAGYVSKQTQVTSRLVRRAIKQLEGEA